MTELEVLRAIEEVVATYGDRKLKSLIGGKETSYEKLLTDRGKVQATKEIITQIRNTLGYDPENI